MAYTALYRKFRPKNFKDVIGQEHILKALTNQIKGNRISHSYLFCGTRGTGKTSTAKIFARVINCENPIEGEPCNECSTCSNVLDNSSVNVMEIDAASNNSVDDIREIIDSVRYVPSTGKYKVFIIDEVHMLSPAAFNALLKTLEEPPNYVVFILATTDPAKIPITILSRCQRHDFKRIKSTNMLETITEYTISENINISEDALRYIVSLSDGAMRDVLSILDQCSGLYMNEEITLEKVQELLGAVDMEIFTKWVNFLNKYDGASLLDIINELVSYGRDINQFTIDLLKYLRNMLYIKTSRNEERTFDLPADKYEIIKNQSETMETENIIKYINTFASFQGGLRYATNPSILLETTVIKLCNPQTTATIENNENLLERIRKIETIIENGELAESLADLIPMKSKSLDEKPEREMQKDVAEKSEEKSDKVLEETFEENHDTEEVKDVVETAKKIPKEWKMIVDKYISTSKASFITQALKTSSFEYVEGRLGHVYFENPVVAKYMQDKQRNLVDEIIKKMYNIDMRIEYKDVTFKKNKKNASENSSNSNNKKEAIPKEYFNFEHIQEE